TYLVDLTVVDSDGEFASQTLSVTVVAPATPLPAGVLAPSSPVYLLLEGIVIGALISGVVALLVVRRPRPSPAAPRSGNVPAPPAAVPKGPE
ncbi:MAG: hypothetical protein ACREC5_05985, partial [Thermoplasmata archaeon]